MDCTHGTPGGSRYCALCRAAVMAAAGQTPRTRGVTGYGLKPMPPGFRDRMAALIGRATSARPVQDQLDLTEEEP